MGNSHTLQKVGAVVTALPSSSVFPNLVSYLLQFFPLFGSGLSHPIFTGSVWLSLQSLPCPRQGQGLTVKLATMQEGGPVTRAHNLFLECTQDPTQCLRVQLPGNKASP